jgi:hypothetical protein
MILKPDQILRGDYVVDWHVMFFWDLGELLGLRGVLSVRSALQVTRFHCDVFFKPNEQESLCNVRRYRSTFKDGTKSLIAWLNRVCLPVE